MSCIGVDLGIQLPNRCCPLLPLIAICCLNIIGTTFTKIGTYHNLRAVLADLGGSRALPSVVAIHQDHFFAPKGTPINDAHIVIGKPALRLQNVGGWIVIFDSKRFLGRVMDDSYKETIKEMGLPFQVVANEAKKAVFRIIFNKGTAGINGEYRNVLPQVVSGHVLRRTVRQVSDRYGFDPKLPVPVVITIPAAFADAQRHATYEAAEMAGLRVLQLLPEPSAAAVAFLMDKGENGTFLVFDFGGGTHDVSLVEVKGNSFVVKGIAGDTLLGGRDIDEAIFQLLLGELREKKIPVDPNDATVSASDQAMIQEALTELRLECINAKEAMLFNEEYPIMIDDIYKGDHEGTLKFTREKLLKVLQTPRPTVDGRSISILDRLFIPVSRVLDDAKMEMKQLKGVILAGGSCHLLPVQEQCRQVFTVKHGVPIMVDESMDVDHLVGIGASLVAQTYVNGTGDIIVKDVLPEPLGWEMHGDRLSVMLRRNQQYPCSVTNTFVTVADNQTSISADIHAGENPVASKNMKLDRMTIRGLPALPAGEAKVEVTYAVNSSGIMEVTVRDQSNSKNVETKLVRVDRLNRMDEKQRTAAANGIAPPMYQSPVIETAFHTLTKGTYRLKNKLSHNTNGTSANPIQPAAAAKISTQLQPVLQFVHGFHGSNLSLPDIASRTATLADLEKQLTASVTPPPPPRPAAVTPVVPAPQPAPASPSPPPVVVPSFTSPAVTAITPPPSSGVAATRSKWQLFSALSGSPPPPAAVVTTKPTAKATAAAS